jgi:hypothetical protein
LPIAWFSIVDAKRTIASAPFTSSFDNIIDNDALTARVCDIRTAHYYPVINYRNRKLKIRMKITIVKV